MFTFLAIISLECNDAPSWIIPMGMVMDFVGTITILLVSHN